LASPSSWKSSRKGGFMYIILAIKIIKFKRPTCHTSSRRMTFSTAALKFGILGAFMPSPPSKPASAVPSTSKSNKARRRSFSSEKRTSGATPPSVEPGRRDPRRLGCVRWAWLMPSRTALNPPTNPLASPLANPPASPLAVCPGAVPPAGGCPGSTVWPASAWLPSALPFGGGGGGGREGMEVLRS